MALKRLVFAIAYSDGRTAEYPLKPAAQVDFEQAYGLSIGAALTSEKDGTTNLYRLAWYAEKAAGGVVKLFEDWIKDIDAVDSVEEKVAPFGKGQAVAGSPGSRSTAA